MLAALRVELGIGIDEMAARTKIHPRHLAALEQDDFANLPAPVYYRGFVDSYLRYLGVNDSKLVSALVSRYQDRRR
jgi:cytoskeletal protein RodZ